MIENVLTVEPIKATDIDGIIQVLCKGGKTALIQPAGTDVTGQYLMWQYVGMTKFFMTYPHHTFQRVTNVEDWDTMSDDTRMDIELALMTKGL